MTKLDAGHVNEFRLKLCRTSNAVFVAGLCNFHSKCVLNSDCWGGKTDDENFRNKPLTVVYFFGPFETHRVVWIPWFGWFGSSCRWSRLLHRPFDVQFFFPFLFPFPLSFWPHLWRAVSVLPVKTKRLCQNKIADLYINFKLCNFFNYF